MMMMMMMTNIMMMTIMGAMPKVQSEEGTFSRLNELNDCYDDDYVCF